MHFFQLTYILTSLCTRLKWCIVWQGKSAAISVSSDVCGTSRRQGLHFTWDWNCFPARATHSIFVTPLYAWHFLGFILYHPAQWGSTRCTKKDRFPTLQSSSKTKFSVQAWQKNCNKTMLTRLMLVTQNCHGNVDKRLEKIFRSSK